MTATVLPGLPTRYYAPAFTVEIEKDELPPQAVADVLEVKVVMDLAEMNSAEIKLNNTDGATRALKWSDGELFRIGNRMHVRLGYADEQLSMLQGQITSIAPEFPATGPPTLTVRALDGMIRLKGTKPDECVYRDVRDWEIARQVAQRNDMQCVVTETEGPRHTLVVQRKQDDASFLMERAARIDFDVYVLTDPDSRQDVLHFVSPTDGRGAAPITVYDLLWGTHPVLAPPGRREGGLRPSLIDFFPTITGSDQVRSVTVRGWDPKRKRAISQTATAGDTPGVGGGDGTGPAAAAALSASGGKRDVIVDAPVLTDEEARHLAEKHLAERSYEYLTGKGRVIGLPGLRPGDNVHLDGLGTRFGGLYYVTRTVHTLGSAGYLTEFEGRRTAEGGAS